MEEVVLQVVVVVVLEDVQQAVLVVEDAVVAVKEVALVVLEHVTVAVMDVLVHVMDVQVVLDVLLVLVVGTVAEEDAQVAMENAGAVVCVEAVLVTVKDATLFVKALVWMAAMDHAVDVMAALVVEDHVMDIALVGVMQTA